METGTNHFLDRIALMNRFDENVKPFLLEHGFVLSDFGHPVILDGNGSMLSHIRKTVYKKNGPVLMVKFSPDFIVAHPESGQPPFFMDTKTSITPIFFQSQINRIRDFSGVRSLRREDIFDIEREAWDIYNRFYPKDRVALCIACPYHPRLLLAEWVTELKPLWRYAEDRNLEAQGSGTPHVNIDMRRMRTLASFLSEEFGVEVDMDSYKVLEDFIKTWDLNKPNRVNWTQYNNVIVELQESCPWLKTRNEPKNWRRRNSDQLSIF